MATERGMVDHHHVVPDPAVMGDMRADHEQAVVADAGHPAAAGGAGMHGDLLADDVVGTDLEARVLAAVLHVLRAVADGREREDPGAGADGGQAFDADMADQFDAVAEPDLRADDAERADRDVRTDLGAGRDDRRWMNARHQRSRIIAEKVASAHSTPSTCASALNFQTLPRLRSLRQWMRIWSPGPIGRRNRASSIVMK